MPCTRLSLPLGEHVRLTQLASVSCVQVLVTVFSRPQLGAILGKMEKEAAERWDRKLSERGQPGRCANRC